MTDYGDVEQARREARSLRAALDGGRAFLDGLCMLFGVPAGPARDEELLAAATHAKGALEGLAEVAMLLGVGEPGEAPSPARVVGVVRGMLSSLAHADADADALTAAGERALERIAELEAELEYKRSTSPAEEE